VDIYEELKAFLVEHLQMDPKAVSPSMAFGDVPEWDSIGHMTLIAALEEAYGIEVTANTISELTSVDAICSYLLKVKNG
jgi:acyl carrier protein